MLSNEVQEYIEELARQGRAERTRSAYATDLGLFAEWFAGTTGEEFSAGVVTPTDVLDYRRHLQVNRGLAPATINRRLAAIRGFCRWAVDCELLTEDPTRRVKGVASVSTAPRSLSRRELGKLIRAVEQDAVTGATNGVRNLAILQVLRNTGLRVGELVQLQLDDIQIAERSGSLTVRAGKGAKHRTVPLNVAARRALQDYSEVRPTSKTPWVFLSQKGGRLTTKAVQRLVVKYAHRAQLEDVTPHTLRHSFAKDVLDQGERLTTVAALLGHENLQTTSIYTQPSGDDLARAVAAIDSSA